jgi:signal transduction histidine kinase
MQRLASVRVRITLASLLVVGIALVVGGIFLVRAQRASLTQNVGSAVALRARDVASAISKGDIPRLLAVPRGDDNLIQVVDAHGRIVASSRNLAGDPRISKLAPDSEGSTVESLDIDEGDGPWWLKVQHVVNHGHGYTLYVASSLDRVHDSVESLEHLLLISFPILMLLLGSTTWVVTGKALRPVESIRREVERIGAEDLHRRVPEPSTHDEIGRLAQTMNAMLSRLEDSQERQHRFLADASHELRSPLTGMRAELELELERELQQGSGDEREQTTRELLADTVRLQRLVEDLLTIAVADGSTLDAAHREPVDLDEIVFAEARRLRAHTSLDVDTSQVSGAQYEVNADQFVRVVRNLLDNAASHANSTVTLVLRETASEIRLVVSDDGPGVPHDDRERIFGRFARLDDARTRGDGGTGLGLAIVREVVAAHGGTVTVDGPPGAAFTVILPLSRADRDGHTAVAAERHTEFRTN